MHSSTIAPKRQLTTLYCLHQAAYFFAMAGVGAFAMAYLLNCGFDAAHIGVMLASGSILSCILQPMIGSYVDRTCVSVLQKIIPAFLISALVSFFAMEMLALPKALTGLLYVFGNLTFSITIPLCNSLCAHYSKNGHSINYGAGSGFGSLSFSFASLGFGYIIAGLGMRAMMLIVMLFIVIQLFLVARYPRITPCAPSAATQSKTSLSIPAFCLRYKMFMTTMAGVICLAACHAMAENFLIQLFERIGGGSEHVGVTLFLACITAAPFLLLFERIQRRIDITLLMRLSGFFYIAKALLLIWAPSIASIYVIGLIQTFTYAFLYPSLYYLVLRRIRPQDMAKGQALASSMFTLGMALGNSLGGMMIDLFGLNAMLAFAAAIAACGTLLVNLAVSRADPC